LTLSNSTIASNTGGGLEVLFADTTIINCTIASNTGGRGGLYWYSFGELTLQNTILANNPAGDYIGVQPASDKSTRNLVSDNSLTVGAIMRNPLLGPLQNNGGPTFTMAPGAGSPAIGGGSASISNASPVKGLDQRSYTRITSDIGAFAFGGTAPQKLFTSTSSLSGTSTLSTEDPVTHQHTEVENPFPGFTGEIHIAPGDYNGDYNGDGIGDTIVGAGEGGGPAGAI
ncbi:MAG: choice-of-anchor Q domain-containing protein, partial [Planctomycetia bacterium]